MTADEALSRLMVGLGYAYDYVRPGVITVRPVRANGARVLGPVQVEGTTGANDVNGVNGSHDVTATEGTRSFTTGAMTIGSKAPRSIKDTPQSVSVISAERLEQQNINDFTRALQQAPGVSFSQGQTSLQPIFYSRGFEITSIQIDGGAPLTTLFGGGVGGSPYIPQIDMSQYDHVEVLRGAAGLFNGYGDPSGTVNLVRKQPLDHEQVSVDSEWGSWNNYRVVLDATAPLAIDGRLRGRAVVTWQSNEHFYAIAEDQKTLLYGVLAFDLTPTTIVTAGVSQTEQHSVPWYGGLPRYQTGEALRLPRDTSLAFLWNRWDFDTTEVFTAIKQQFGKDWTAKLNVTRNEQSSTRKVGYSSGALNPIDDRGPRLNGTYNDYSTDQLAAEATLAGAFNLFGQRQEVTLGVNRSEQDAGGQVGYLQLVTSSATSPYQPYPGGPRFCTSLTLCPSGLATPPVDVFAFNPFDPIYTEPADPLPASRYPRLGQTQSLAYLNLRLTAFDRLHLETGVRWSRYETRVALDRLCTSIPTTGAPSSANCVGRKIGDAYAQTINSYSGERFSWPPSAALSYDLTDAVTAYLGYTDIYEDQSQYLDQDFNELAPVTGENIELGIKWAPRDGRLNTTLSVYRINKEGFNQRDTSMPLTQPVPAHSCCFFQSKDRTQVSEGVDAELTGEMLPGWQIAASYTFGQTAYKGRGYRADEGQPFTSIQPEHLYKLWTSYDFGAAGQGGWLSKLSIAGGINGQSKAYFSGSACPADRVGTPDPLTGIAPCLVPQVPYDFTVEPYAVASGRIDYRLNDSWFAALNIENLFDKIYYESIGGTISSGNWYGTPRSFTLSLRGRF